MTPALSSTSAQQDQRIDTPRLAAAARVVRAVPALSESSVPSVDPGDATSYICCDVPRIPATPAESIPVAPSRVARTDLVRGERFTSRLEACSVYDVERRGGLPDHIRMLHESSPKDDKNQVNFVSNWSNRGDEYWEFILKTTVCRLRRESRRVAFDAGEAAKLKRMLERCLLPESTPRIADLQTLLDVIDERVPRIVGHIRGLEVHERDARAAELGKQLVRFNNPRNSVPLGVERTIEFMDVLNWRCPDCFNHRYLIP